MSDRLKSFIRTGVPLVAGYLATLLVDAAAAKLGVQIDDKTAYAIVYAAVTFALYAAARSMETWRWAPARALARLVLSAGADLGKPSYPPPAPAGSVRPLKRHEL